MEGLAPIDTAENVIRTGFTAINTLWDLHVPAHVKHEPSQMCDGVPELPLGHLTDAFLGGVLVALNARVRELDATKPAPTLNFMTARATAGDLQRTIVAVNATLFGFRCSFRFIAIQELVCCETVDSLNHVSRSRSRFRS